MAMECKKCGDAIQEDDPSLHYDDAEYCLDCWSGYDPCGYCGCYRCEHGAGIMTTVYSKDHPETVGQQTDWGYGCQPSDCPKANTDKPCTGFVEKAN
jgi:hypothetical protein